LTTLESFSLFFFDATRCVSMDFGFLTIRFR
jgi:hypothetical protein